MYYEMFNKVKNGEITEKEWQDYCFVVLTDLLLKNIDVFKRLKNR